ARDCVLLPLCSRQWPKGDSRGEQSSRRAGFEFLTVCGYTDWQGHQPAVETDIEDLPTVGTPAGLSTAIRGYPRLATRPWKRLHVNLKSSRFVRAVGDPFAVRRELSVALFETCLHDRKRFLLTGERQRPNVISRLGSEALIQQEAAVR